MVGRFSQYLEYQIINYTCIVNHKYVCITLINWYLGAEKVCITKKQKEMQYNLSDPQHKFGSRKGLHYEEAEGNAI